MFDLNEKYEFMAEEKWKRKIDKIMEKHKMKNNNDEQFWKVKLDEFDLEYQKILDLDEQEKQTSLTKSSLIQILSKKV